MVRPLPFISNPKVCMNRTDWKYCTVNRTSVPLELWCSCVSYEPEMLCAGFVEFCFSATSLRIGYILCRHDSQHHFVSVHDVSWPLYQNRASFRTHVRSITTLITPRFWGYLSLALLFSHPIVCALFPPVFVFLLLYTTLQYSTVLCYASSNCRAARISHRCRLVSLILLVLRIPTCKSWVILECTVLVNTLRVCVCSTSFSVIELNTENDHLQYRQQQQYHRRHHHYQIYCT